MPHRVNGDGDHGELLDCPSSLQTLIVSRDCATWLGIRHKHMKLTSFDTAVNNSIITARHGLVIDVNFRIRLRSFVIKTLNPRYLPVIALTLVFTQPLKHSRLYHTCMPWIPTTTTSISYAPITHHFDLHHGRAQRVN